MPVRIYDISKKLGLENKEVLTKAKELGIAAARVASSSLDKITAEYLEQQLVLAHPERAAQPPAGPKVGDKVGFIQLPTKPAPKFELNVGGPTEIYSLHVHDARRRRRRT